MARRFVLTSVKFLFWSMVLGSPARVLQAAGVVLPKSVLNAEREFEIVMKKTTNY